MPVRATRTAGTITVRAKSEGLKPASVTIKSRAFAAADEVLIARDDLEELRPSRVSVMPSGLDQQLSPQELADLIAVNKADGDARMAALRAVREYETALRYARPPDPEGDPA